MSRVLILLGAAFVVGLLIFAVSMPPGGDGRDGGLSALPPMPSSPPEGDDWFREVAFDNEALVILDFSAKWCGPCHMMHPVLVKLDEEFEDSVDLVEVDVDQHPKVAGHYNAFSLPTVLLMQNGQIVNGIIGFSSPENDYQRLKKMIEDQLSSPAGMPKKGKPA